MHRIMPAAFPVLILGLLKSALQQVYEYDQMTAEFRSGKISYSEFGTFKKKLDTELLVSPALWSTGALMTRVTVNVTEPGVRS